jgi:hypothetical protein
MSEGRHPNNDGVKAMRDYKKEPMTTEEWQRQCLIDRVWQHNLDRWAAEERGRGRGCHRGPGDPDYRWAGDKQLFNWVWGRGE